MQDYICMCGYTKIWKNRPPAKCDRCEKCGTTFELKKEDCKNPKEHSFIVKYREGTKEPYRECIGCGAEQELLKD